jgi:histidinol-phosphate/aromatic aminotransferase/cobyric acid decarboxylase-like protein
MFDQCMRPNNCPCSMGKRIDATRNTPGGAAMAYHVPGVLLAKVMKPGLNFDYCAANDPHDEYGMATRTAIGEMEGAPYSNVLIYGSSLELFGRLPRALARQTIVKLQDDFSGFTRGAGGDIRVVEIPNESKADPVDAEIVAKTVRDLEKPIVFCTFCMTNPGQREVRLDVVSAALSANDNAIVVMDGAYRRYGMAPNLASFALSNDRVIYVQPASKDLFFPGGRLSWMITSDPLLARLTPTMLPFAVGPDSLLEAHGLLQMPRVIDQLRQTQERARDILVEGTKVLGIPMRSGLGPWVLIRFGADSKPVVEELSNKYNIAVQLQAGHLEGWIRISATVPCHAARIVKALTEIVAERRERDGVREILAKVPMMKEYIQKEIRRGMDQAMKEARVEAERERAAAWAPLLDERTALSSSTLKRCA